MLEPSYRPGADRQLDRLMADDSRDQLYREVVSKLYMICEHPESKEARQRQMRSSRGEIFHWVPLYAPRENENWRVVWAPDGDEAVFMYIGPWPPTSDWPYEE